MKYYIFAALGLSLLALALGTLSYLFYLLHCGYRSDNLLYGPPANPIAVLRRSLGALLARVSPFLAAFAPFFLWFSTRLSRVLERILYNHAFRIHRVIGSQVALLSSLAALSLALSLLYLGGWLHLFFYDEFYPHRWDFPRDFSLFARYFPHYQDYFWKASPFDLFAGKAVAIGRYFRTREAFFRRRRGETIAKGPRIPGVSYYSETWGTFRGVPLMAATSAFLLPAFSHLLHLVVRHHQLLANVHPTLTPPGPRRSFYLWLYELIRRMNLLAFPLILLQFISLLHLLYGYGHYLF
jgi:hypothetical protein